MAAEERKRIKGVKRRKEEKNKNKEKTLCPSDLILSTVHIKQNCDPHLFRIANQKPAFLLLAYSLFLSFN